MRTVITSLYEKTAWHPWIPLENSWRGKKVPAGPGLYRILLVDEEHTQMAYIGQSKNLKERLGALKHVYSDVSPLHDPHFAGPALWTWRQALPRSHFEVSVAPFPTIPKPLRLGLECLALALCHQEQDVAPLANFGRTRDEWSALWSSSPERQMQEVRLTGPLDGNPHARSWCGLDWTSWTLLDREHLPEDGLGLYRLRVAGCDPLLYIGQGEIAARLKAYRSNLPLECSWVLGSWTYHRRLELRSNAVGAHLLSLSTIPLWQFESGAPLGGPAGMSSAA
ncbi:hypothetical protein KDA_74710 [Dictyobacter alpinus]|uniref:GIY-YIG domain-containing protein n=1 Tax=Dictyobacter alpinus TaxID=2014873 RepID=A0A402BKU4_9CHLR|nr:hypothetical protein [Dictyobacter alpinus]GCE31987.1 hypothetical protein KDA_74710 [Dictyobacter alpinus]